jgi:hypothetical protein
MESVILSYWTKNALLTSTSTSTSTSTVFRAIAPPVEMGTQPLLPKALFMSLVVG